MRQIERAFQAPDAIDTAQPLNSVTTAPASADVRSGLPPPGRTDVGAAGRLHDGRIPLRIRVGIFGQRDLVGDDDLAACLRGQLARIRLLVAPCATPVGLTAVSQLADGADRIGVRELAADAAARGECMHLEVVLPMNRHDYVLAQAFGAASRAEFEQLLDVAASVRVSDADPPARIDPERRHSPYERSGDCLIEQSDVLVALWSGRSSRGPGGTAEVLLRAAAAAKPSIWIRTTEGFAVIDNLTPGSAVGFYELVAARAAVEVERTPSPPSDDDVLVPLHKLAAAFEAYNAVKVSPADLDERVASALRGPVDNSWIAGALARASALAEDAQRAFRVGVFSLAAFAVVAAGSLAATVAFPEAGRAPKIIELAALVVVLALWVGMQARHTHDRWLVRRLLAERLRTARYLAATGVEYPPEPAVTSWLERAFAEVWESRPRPAAPVDFCALRSWIGDWVCGQIAYHEGAACRHLRAHRLLFVLMISLFAAGVVFTGFHAFDQFGEVATLLAVFFPGAAAAVGLIVSVRQDRGLGERYVAMQKQLEVVADQICTATRETLAAASAEAARVIAQETGDWYGAMRFHDVEHLP